MLSIYILILGLISGVTMETCPEPEAIYPCKCMEIKITKTIFVDCNTFTRTPMTLKGLEHVLNGLLGKNNVVLHLYQIQDILPSNIFSGVGINFLEFWSLRMDFLTNADHPGLLGLENHLEILNIRSSDFSSMKLHLRHLNKLKSMTLFDSNIPELDGDWLSEFPSSLDHLYFWGNSIGKIGSHAFSRLNSLRTLYLDDNRFGPMKRSMFPDRLEMLSLRNNTLTDLPVDLFSRMPSIVYVNLNENRISTLDERTWSPIWQQLKYLELKTVGRRVRLSGNLKNQRLIENVVNGNNIVCDDRLNWIMKSKRRPEITGECSAPKELEKTSLEEFFRRKSS